MMDLDANLGSLLFEHGPLHVAVLDRERRILRASARFVETFGDGVGRTCFDVCKGQESPCTPCPVEAVFGGEVAPSYQQSLRTELGEEFICKITATALNDDRNGGLVVLIAEDRTELTALREEVARSERLANVGLTAAGLAHTIKNLLGGMEGAVYTVDTGLDKSDDARVRSGWEMVSNYIGQVSSLVRNLLSYTRQSQPERQEQDPGSIARDVVELFDQKGSLVGVSVRDEVDQGTPLVWMDAQIIHACLSNLVSNALDACMWDPDDTKESAIVVVVRPRQGGGVVFEVQDNGVGISEENQRKVLASSFTTKGMRGTGLGLLLTRMAVEQHGGEIGFSSTAGQGSCFRIEIPAGAPAAEPTPS